MADESRKITQIAIDDGSRTYQLTNEAGEIVAEFSISPTDAGIFERLSRMNDEISEIIKPVEAIGEDFSLEQYGDVAEQVKDRMFAVIDKTLGRSVAAQMFARLHPLSPVGGRFYFDRVLEAVGGIIEAALADEAAQFADEKVTRYTNRAQRRAKK